MFISPWPNFILCLPCAGDSVVHFLTEEARSRYDMETLWALGHEYDDKVEEMISLNQVIGVFDTKVKK